MNGSYYSSPLYHKKKIYLYYTILKKVKITTGFLHPVTQHLEENLENGRHLNFC